MKIRPSILLFVGLGLVFATSITWLTEKSEPSIALNQEKKTRELMQRMIASEKPGLTLETFTLLAPNYLKMGDIQTAARVIDEGKPTQVIYRSISHDGYSGKIGILASFEQNCTVSHVEILTEKETPGLGDQYKKDNFAWLKSLKGKTINTNWALKPEGDIDTWTGATVTPTAINQAIQRMQLLCVDENDLLFSQENILYLETGRPNV